MVASSERIQEGSVLSGPQFNEPMRVVGAPFRGTGFLQVNLVGVRARQYRQGVTLADQDLTVVAIETAEARFRANPGSSNSASKHSGFRWRRNTTPTSAFPFRGSIPCLTSSTPSTITC